MKILAIETSCDETALAVIEVIGNSVIVLANTISSQIKLHAKYGGVVPNLAAREHVKNIGHVFKLALKEAKISVRGGSASGGKNFDKEIDLIAVTRGPGLGPALLVGISFAKTLAWKYNKPIVGVSHLEGHIYSNWLNADNSQSTIDDRRFPVLNLIVSGGHTELVLMKDYGKYKIIGETLDDAVGEAFDKVARLLGLGYPGGPIIDQRATKFKVESLELKIIGEFPRPMLKSKNYNFSYSGLKTAVLYKTREFQNNKVKITDNVINEICYEFQKAAIEVLLYKTIRAAKEYKAKSIMLSGGVSANKHLRLELEKLAKENNIKYFQPEFEYTGDNAAMIGVAGYMNYKIKSPSSLKLQRTTDFSWKSVEMDANLGF